MEPVRAGNAPIKVELQAGKTYAWCSCGQSSNQPFCDGSHSGSGYVPKMFTADKDQTAFLCTCKATSNPGFCDGSHNK